jgi:oxygen-independent coproporphyrinogen-3 oxidase
MECNPGTITLDSLKAYKDLGINRLSFGIQSFHQKELDFLHRIHSPIESIEAVSLARQAGFDNINIDLIFALPDQQMNSWQQTLEMAIELQTEHISAYSLIFEEKTPLYTMLQKGLVKPSEEEKDADMYAYTIETLTSAGYSQYEVSNFAKDGYSCVHNRTYWQAKEYIAFGPSAHGFLHNKRYWNYRNLIRYFEAVEKNGKGEANVEELSAYNRLFETVFLSFRAEGLNINDIKTEFDIDILSILEKEFALWKQEKLIELHDSMISLTAKGYALCDELSVRIIASLEVFLGQEWDNQGYQEDESEEEDTIVYTLPILDV